MYVYILIIQAIQYISWKSQILGVEKQNRMPLLQTVLNEFSNYIQIAWNKSSKSSLMV